MQGDVLEKKAAEIYAAASHPEMQDVLYLDSLRAVWNAKLNTFDRLMIRGMKHSRQYPSMGEKFTVYFYAGDDTSMTAVHKAVARRIAALGVTKKKTRKTLFP